MIELNGKSTIREYMDNYKVIGEYLKENGYVPQNISEQELIKYVEDNADIIKIYMTDLNYVEVIEIVQREQNSDEDNNTSSGTNGSTSTPENLDDIFNLADDFFNSGLENEGRVINLGNLQITSNFVYNILLSIAIVVAVIWGMILGIQFLIGSAEQRAETKKALAPYLVGCVVIFGAFGIWAFVVNILQTIK